MHCQRLVCLAVVLSSLSLSSAAMAEDFIDTRLTFVVSENNFFAEPGDTFINSPGLGIGADESNTLFFDNYDTRFSGFETLSHLVLYKKMPSFFNNLTTEAALVLRAMIIDEATTRLRDSGSYIRLAYDLSGGKSDDKNLELVLFPISGDRFRLGYSYKISWGGSGIFPLNEGIVPGAKLQLNMPWGFGFLGVKTTQIKENVGNTEQTELVTNAGLLGGAGVDVNGIRAEANGGYFTRGAFQQEGVRGEPISGYGASYQVGYHSGMEIGTSIDFKLYQNDPDMEINFFRPEQYGEGLSFLLKHEGSFLWQTVIDPEKFGTIVNQMAYAFDVNFAVKAGFFRAHLDAMFRSLSFLLYEVPSFEPYVDFSPAAEANPEFFGAVGMDYHFPGPRLTPGVKFGLQQPATYTTQDLQVGAASFDGKRTVVVLGPGQRSVLPIDEEALLIWSLKANLKWDISEILALVGEVYFSYDRNQTRYVSDFYGMNVQSEFTAPEILGLNIAAQGRF